MFDHGCKLLQLLSMTARKVILLWGLISVQFDQDTLLGGGRMPPKWVSFSPKILRQGSHFSQKKSLEDGPIASKLRKICKISHF